MLVKGASNYLSLRRLRVAQQRTGPACWAIRTMRSAACSRSASNRVPPRTAAVAICLFQAVPSVWDLVESDSGNCLGRSCGRLCGCFYFKARKQIFGANVLIVNHALFFSDLALRAAREPASCPITRWPSSTRATLSKTSLPTIWV